MRAWIFAAVVLGLAACNPEPPIDDGIDTSVQPTGPTLPDAGPPKPGKPSTGEDPGPL